MEHTRALPIVVSLVILLAGAATARAEPVVVLPARGTLPVEDLVAFEERTFDAVEAAGHAAFGERGALQAPEASRPETANELRAVAEMQGATYAVDPAFHPADRGRVRVLFRVGYAPETRVEELEIEVPGDAPEPMMREAIALLLRPEGAGPEAADRLAEAEAARRAALAEAARREAEAAREAREAAAAAEREAQEAAEEAARPGPYGEGRSWMLGAGLAARPIIAKPANALGGTVGSVDLVGGYAFEGVPGLEARASAELWFGDAGAFALTVGAVYLFQPFGDLPLFVGPGVDVGWAQHTTGSHSASLLLRAKPVVAWRLSESLQLEAVLPEIQYLSADGGSALLGFGARLGARF